jgi:hypothetical protein
MTSAPSDLLALRSTVIQKTGLSGNSVGVVGDGIHQRTGGYHEGHSVLVSIGRFHGPATAHVGAAAEDYSARIARDRSGLTDHASAMDIGCDWPNGGRAAWLRFNNALYAELRDHPERLPALRGANLTLDGTSRKRYDTAHRDQGLIPSTDSVTIHTHMEFWRDTEGRRQATLDRIAQLITAAVSGTDQGGPVASGDTADFAASHVPGVGGSHIALGNLLVDTAAIKATLTAIAAKVDIDPAELDAIKAAAQSGAHDAVTASIDELVAKFIAALPSDLGDEVAAKAEAALRSVFADAGTA